ncbi:DUF5320 domain-containing protein [Thermodesulfobacteriota bacterium]
MEPAPTARGREDEVWDDAAEAPVWVAAKGPELEAVVGRIVPENVGQTRIQTRIPATALLAAGVPDKGGKIMPGFDRSGPWGAGPRTGGEFGYCGPAGGSHSTFNPYDRGGGFGRGPDRGYGARGGYRGRCRWASPYFRGLPGPIDTEEEKAFLQNQIAELRAEMAAMEARLSEIENVSE